MQSNFLSGITVVDVTRVLAGPYCTMMLADLGADVIKIEEPNRGDETRSYAPTKDGESAYYLSINRNKKSFCLDLKSEEGREKLYDIVSRADIFIHNYPQKTSRKLGIDFDTIRKKNNKIIYLSITGYGNTGPKAHLPGYDIITQAISGLVGINGTDMDHLARIPNSTTDLYGGFISAIMILSSLFKSRNDGLNEPIELDVSLLEATLYTMPHLFGIYSFNEVDPSPIGFENYFIEPYTRFETADDPIIIAVANDSQWRKLCSLMGLELLLEDERFRGNDNRVTNFSELRDILNNVFVKKPSAHWVDGLTEAGVPVGKINRLSDVLKDDQVRYRHSVLKREVRGKTMYFPAFPVYVNGSRPDFFRNDPPELCDES